MSSGTGRQSFPVDLCLREFGPGTLQHHLSVALGMGERSCAPLGLSEMPATLAELWNRALMSRASASPTTNSASPCATLEDSPVENEELQAEVAALLTEEGENAVLNELLGEMSPGYAPRPPPPPSPPSPPAPPSHPFPRPPL